MSGEVGRNNAGVYWISSHIRRSLYDEKIVYFSVPVVSMVVLIGQYQFFLVII